MVSLHKGRYAVRLADRPEDVEAAQRLRQRAFRGDNTGVEADGFDADCQHVLIEDVASGELVSCFRLLRLDTGAEIEKSYSAQFYDLSGLKQFPAPMAEIGRFCIDPSRQDPDILRVAWGAMTAFVDRERVEMLFGCSSFQGTNAEDYADAFALLRDRHLAPKRWLPRIKASNVFQFSQRLRYKPNLKRAQSKMPPLLRTYLFMGGWVSDHAVIDRDLNTLHVFTGLEIGAVPAARAQSLRSVAG